METKTEESKEEQWKKNPSSLSSSSRSSSITFDESDSHFDIRHFPLPKPVLSASEAQKQRELHQAYSSSVSSYTSSSWSSVHQNNNLADLPGYDPNRIPSSVFANKPVGTSADWSIASNESLFSIHDMNFTISSSNLNLNDIPRFEVTEVNPVPLPPPVKKPQETEKEMVTEKKQDQEVKSNAEIEESMISDDEHEEKGKVLVESKTEKEKEIVEDVKETNQEDSISIVSHSPSFSCRSDMSNNSINSFAFPLLQKDDGTGKTPEMELNGKVTLKGRPEYLLPQTPKQPPKPHPQFYQESGTLTQLQQQSQGKALKPFMKSPKASRHGLLSCFVCPSKCGLFK